MRPFDADRIGEEEAMILASYMMAMVKENVAGCGGISQFIAIRNDGTTSPVALDELERIAPKYDKAAHELLFCLATDGDDTLNRKLEEFGGQARIVKDYWAKLKRSNRAVGQYLQLPIAFRSPQRPSQE
jgi:hypothetical protein